MAPDSDQKSAWSTFNRALSDGWRFIGKRFGSAQSSPASVRGLLDLLSALQLLALLPAGQPTSIVLAASSSARTSSAPASLQATRCTRPLPQVPAVPVARFRLWVVCSRLHLDYQEFALILVHFADPDSSVYIRLFHSRLAWSGALGRSPLGSRQFREICPVHTSATQKEISEPVVRRTSLTFKCDQRLQSRLRQRMNHGPDSVIPWSTLRIGRNLHPLPARLSRLQRYRALVRPEFHK